jgi:septal ring factor EnvC (AmiA/AmiB activator)
MPPSEATMSIVRSYQNQLESRVASGHLTRAQARELLYTKLSEIQPPLPNLNELLEFRKQIEAQVEARSLTPEQAESRLAARESDMLRNWEEMAAKYAQEQREFGRRQQEQERGFRQQQMPIGGRPF